MKLVAATATYHQPLKQSARFCHLTMGRRRQRSKRELLKRWEYSMEDFIEMHGLAYEVSLVRIVFESGQLDPPRFFCIEHFKRCLYEIHDMADVPIKHLLSALFEEMHHEIGFWRHQPYEDGMCTQKCKSKGSPIEFINDFLEIASRILARRKIAQYK